MWPLWSVKLLPLLPDVLLDVGNVTPEEISGASRPIDRYSGNFYPEILFACTPRLQLLIGRHHGGRIGAFRNPNFFTILGLESLGSVFGMQ